MSRIKEQLTVWERAEIAAKLSAIAYMNPKPAETACKKLGFSSGKLISNGGAEVLIAKDRNDLWFAFRGTEPSKLNDVMADLKIVLKYVDMLMVNDSEARQLSGQFSLVKAARSILEMGPKYLIIKKGEHGALLFHGDQVFYAPALPLEDVFDPTGAGDTFAGGLMGYLAKTVDISFDNMKRGIIVGSALASFCVEKFGPTRLKEINQDDINGRIRLFQDLVNFDIELS